MSSGMNGTKSRGVFSSVEEMKAANLRVGVRVDVYGGDTYDIYATDQGASIPLDNGLWAEVVDKPVDSYRGLWPDSGGSALKDEIWQTQVGGTPTGNYYTALQNTSVDPVGDNVNWRQVVTPASFAEYTDIVYQASGSNSAVENMLAGIPVEPKLGAVVSTGGTFWLRETVSAPSVIGDFSQLGFADSSDFGDIDGLLSGASKIDRLSTNSKQINITAPFEFDGFNRTLDGGIDKSLAVGDRSRADGAIVKTGNQTINLVKGDSTTVARDCIMYTNFEFRNFDGDDYFPSNSKIENISLVGTGTTEAGYSVGLASNININKMAILGCVDSLDFFDVFKSQMSNVKFDGQFRYRNGTSMVLTNFTALPTTNPSVSFAYNIENMLYSELHGCTSDNGNVPVFRFRDSHGVTLTSCGTENNNYEGAHGKFIYSEGFNELTIIGANIANQDSDTKANFRFDEGDNIQIIGGRSNLELGVRTNPDIYIHRNGCNVEIWGHTFKDQTDPSNDSIPEVVFNAGVTDATVTVHLKEGRTVVIRPDGTRDSSLTAWTPSLSVNGTSFDFGIDSATGYYSIKDRMVTLNGRIKLNTNSITAGQVIIGNLPFSCSSLDFAAVSFFTEYTQNVPFYARLTNGNNIFLYKESTAPDLNREIVTKDDLSDISEIVFSVTYRAST